MVTPPPLKIHVKANTHCNRDGSDGQWSTFVLNIGNPSQTVKVLVSTVSYQTWVVAPEGCQSGDLVQCGVLRGESHDYNKPSTCVSNLSNISANIYPLTLESHLGYSGRARYGFDDIALGYIGSSGICLKNQTVAGLATKSYFMGLFGLSPRSSNFTSLNNPIPSFMQNLKTQSMIPSLSWAYTAGNQYQLDKTVGSLTLGGYDSSRFIPYNVSFPFNIDSSLALRLDSIYTSTHISLLPTSIKSISLDSTVAYMYPPSDACPVFESEFGLVWNTVAQLYLLNDRQHAALKSKNPSVIFKLGAPPLTVTITLPYSAFDLKASWPLVNSSTPYFPLKRAENETQYVLGRTFFQEAYIIADYERGNFSGSQCRWDQALSEHIIPIFPQSNATSASTGKSRDMGVVLGVAIGATIPVLLILLSVLYFFYLKPRRRGRKPDEVEANVPAPDENAKQGLDSAVASPITGEFGDIKFPPAAHEVGDTGFSPAVEIGGTETSQIFELPAREEVAIEMTGLSKPTELGP